MLCSIPPVFITVRVLDVIDILLVAFLFYQVYMLIRGTVAINIFMGIFGVYLVWLLVQALNMELLSRILGQVIGVGVIALIIVFQQEIRRFLLLIGTRHLSRYRLTLDRLFFGRRMDKDPPVNTDMIIRAVRNLAESRTGALIVIAGKSDLRLYAETGDLVNAHASSRLIESIFYKNSPLHDGAIIIRGGLILAARCVLPLTDRLNLPAHHGLRHRAAIGISELSDAQVVLVSEETGRIAFFHHGEIVEHISVEELRDLLRKG